MQVRRQLGRHTGIPRHLMHCCMRTPSAPIARSLNHTSNPGQWVGMHAVTKLPKPAPRDTLRMGLPSKGRMAEDTLQLLKVSVDGVAWSMLTACFADQITL